MTRSKSAHKREKKRRHERQVEAGTRTSAGRKVTKYDRKEFRLSELDPEVVQQVLKEVSKTRTIGT